MEPIGQPAGQYALRRFVIGSRVSLDLSENEYVEIIQARATLDANASFEEKFFALCDGYRRIEEFALNTALSHMIYGQHDLAEMHSVRARLGSLMSGFLSLTRLYLDSIQSDAGLISQGQVEAAAVKAILSAHYDSCFCYRLMEAIRNFAQHRAFPVTDARFLSRTSEDLSQNLYSVEFYLQVAKVEADNMFKASVRKELLAHGPKIDMKRCLRLYFQSLCDAHASFRLVFDPYKLIAQGIVETWRKRWKASFPDQGLLGVGACKLAGRFRDEAAKTAYIDPQLDEYPRWLIERTSHLGNMFRRSVAF